MTAYAHRVEWARASNLAAARLWGRMTSLVQDFDARDLFDDEADGYGDEFGWAPAPDPEPSLAVILSSTAGGIGGGVIGLYLGLQLFDLGIELSAGLATLALLFSMGVSGALVSAATGARGAGVNMIFSCATIVLVLLFFAVCALAGAAGAALLVGW